MIFLVDNLYKLLYIIRVNDVFDILSSRARALVLRTLFLQSNAIPLRHIAYISGLAVFSVQKALAGLLADDVIRRRDAGNCTLFELNRDAPFYPLLQQFFIAEMNHRIMIESGALGEKAKFALGLASSAAALFNRAKRKQRAK